ncbi:hypothetical protein PM082_001557 [Marasmius tenuissimus]|nr:hypothetical protein PM082_001557 [Marasmius tenuissimus]
MRVIYNVNRDHVASFGKTSINHEAFKSFVPTSPHRHTIALLENFPYIPQISLLTPQPFQQLFPIQRPNTNILAIYPYNLLTLNYYVAGNDTSSPEYFGDRSLWICFVGNHGHGGILLQEVWLYRYMAKHGDYFSNLKVPIVWCRKFVEILFDERVVG